MPHDHYRTLGVAADATVADLRAAYLKLARANHPDTFDGARTDSAEATMQAINEAWNVLGTPQRRTEYDRGRSGGQRFGDRRAGSATSSPFRGHARFRPFDDEPLRRVDVDLDETPIPGSRPIPQWASLMPFLFVAAGIVSFGLGVMVNAAAVVAFAAAIFVLGVAGFLVLPLWAMSRAERDPRL